MNLLTLIITLLKYFFHKDFEFKGDRDYVSIRFLKDRISPKSHSFYKKLVWSIPVDYKRICILWKLIFPLNCSLKIKSKYALVFLCRWLGAQIWKIFLIYFYPFVCWHPLCWNVFEINFFQLINYHKCWLREEFYFIMVSIFERN